MWKPFFKYKLSTLGTSPVVVLAVLLWVLLRLTGCDKVENEPFQPAQTLKFGGIDGFANSVNPLFDQSINDQSCASSGCHNMDDLANESKGGRFKINANVTAINSIEMTQNYLNALSFTNINQPEASALLLEPLAGSYASVGSHGGGDVFISTDDINYQQIYRWIANPVDSDSD